MLCSYLNVQLPVCVESRTVRAHQWPGLWRSSPIRHRAAISQDLLTREGTGMLHNPLPTVCSRLTGAQQCQQQTSGCHRGR